MELTSPVLAASYRDTWAEISQDAIAHNITLFKSHVHERCKVMAVVKADGYGHGAVETAREAIKGGAGYIGVALLDEALQLREAGIATPILILGYTPPRSVTTAIAHGITLTVYDCEVLNAIIACSNLLGIQAAIHLKVDTGMSRIGVQSIEEAVQLAELAARSPQIKLEGLFTHFASADDDNAAYTEQQFQTFLAFADALRERGIPVPIRHCCNSAAAMRYPAMHLDMVRIGIALYGLHPASAMKHDWPLKQAMSLRSRISAIRHIAPHQPVSYGCSFVPERPSVIATIPIGYADGLSRQLSNRGCALLRGERIPIAGRICMDQTMLDVTDIADARAGDEVTLFGRSGGQLLAIDELAHVMNTINYEVVCLIGKRVPRVNRR
ncbi:alanine racemase [Paenibacillus sp. J5C_2022]|uniref:alanine racemase n=1 Tax=Paenibacillus sp. J5C2022 TaxID=2977129 RepID=UPI0021D2AF32|nr:alanine racemase [Paenibacillus sp. J5C2022]MCU6710532.1 alanine racemase [Paenibacillus sp. J5C2022]